MTLMFLKMIHHNFNFALDMERKYINILVGVRSSLWHRIKFHTILTVPAIKTRLMKFGTGILCGI